MSSRPPDLAGLRNRLSNLKHTHPDREAQAAQAIRRTTMNEKSAPHNPSVKLDGEGIGETSGEMLLNDDAEEEDSLMYSLHSSSSSMTSGGGSGDADAKVEIGDSTVLNGNGNMNSSGSNGDGNAAKRHRNSSFEIIDDLGRRPPARRGRARRKQKHEIVDESSSRWFGYDLSIIVALVSPIGNMLTGGDHVKNILLLLLLVYYLHQLVEVPWALYKESIPRNEPEEKEEENPERKLQLAHAELQSYEIIYLTLTVLSPFLGATLLRLVATAITGDTNTLSWFSTSLYVLATGIRPWTHLVERLKSRSRALNDILRELEDKESRTNDGEEYVEEDISELRSYMLSLDERLLRLSDKGNTEAKEIYEHLQGVVEGMDKTLRRHRSELVKSTQAQSARVAVLEARINGLDMALEKSLFESERGDGLSPHEAWEWFLGVTWSAWIYARHVSARYGIGKYPVTTRSGSGRSLKLMGPGATVSPPLSRRSSRHLEPIAEEDAPATAQPSTSGVNGQIASSPGGKPAEATGTVLVRSQRTRRSGGVRRLLRRCFSVALRVMLSPFTLTAFVFNAVLSVPLYLYRAVFS